MHNTHMHFNRINNQIEVKIINHNMLFCSTNATAEMYLLIYGSKKAHKLIKKLVADGYPKELMGVSFNVPVNNEERYQRALDLVNAIGRAAGRELYEIGHKGDLEHLYRIFCEGTTSSRDKNIIGSSVEQAFFNCGLEAGTIIFNVVKPDTKEKFGTIMNDARNAFVEGVKQWAA